ncbi:DUF2971 domain-containing protein [Aeromonas veronii]|uniref:DUF2971 domain-containing protein n=1 Tax=Aeromonas veronii TaxID=654 RepID=UPI001F47AC27|nr:DUF2971 domain-containing protein [Aeromonas veronii]MCF5764866.1 DUF2971 domain-containing protein [Aeromonas veronii]
MKSPEEKYAEAQGLCKFYNNNLLSLMALSKGYLWCSDSNDFNDPFENNVNSYAINRDLFDTDAILMLLDKSSLELKDSDDIDSLDLKLFDESVKRGIVDNFKETIIDQTLINIKESIDFHSDKKYVCLSMNVDAIHKSKLLWSHYSNGLRGFAIEFDVEMLLHSISEKNKDSMIGVWPISYSDLGMSDYLIENIKSKDVSELDANKIYLYKHTDWSYENELRIISKVNELQYSHSCVKKVYIGEKMPENYKELLVDILSSKGLIEKTYIAKVNREEFVIDFSTFR